MVKKTMDASFKVRLSEGEKEAFAQAAQLAGMTLAAWLRHRLRDAAERELTGRGLPVSFLKSVTRPKRRT